VKVSDFPLTNQQGDSELPGKGLFSILLNYAGIQCSLPEHM